MSRTRIFIRSVFIYIATILFGTSISAYFLSGIIQYSELFLVGIIMSSVFSLPAILFLAIGIRLCYINLASKRQLYARLLIMNTAICIPPFVVFYILHYFEVGGLPMEMLYNSGGNIIIMALPYIIISYILTPMVNLLMDKKYPLKVPQKVDDQILDDAFVNE